MSDVPIAALTSAIVFGLYAGLSPGPTLTLVISQTLRHGRVEGFKVAIAPLLTDGPIVVVALWVLNRLEGRSDVLGVISCLGAAFLVYVALDCFRGTTDRSSEHAAAPRSVMKGVLANTLNPHPYIGWMTVVGPAMMSAASAGLRYAALFLVSFYGVMIGAKMLVAVVTERGDDVLQGRGRRVLMVVLGLALLVFAVRFGLRGARLLTSGA